MGAQSRQVTTFIYVVSLYLISFCPAFQSDLEVVQERSLAVLSQEFNGVYVRSLKHDIQIANRSPVPVKGDLFIPLVKNETSRRYVILHNVSSSSETQGSVQTDSHGNIYFHLYELRIDGKQTFTIKLEYHVLSFNTRYLINSTAVGDYDTSSDLYREYTSPEELIECDHSNITSLSRSLTGNIADWHGKVFKIYDFVRGHISYQVQDEERGALWALKTGVGDCSEYSYLFVALCRAAGIPARIKAGFAFHREGETLEDGHMWAEYYTENYGWTPVDVSWKLFDMIDDKHFSSIQSAPEVMKYANFFFDSKPENADLEDEQTVSLMPCSTDVFGDSLVENVIWAVQRTNQAKSAIRIGRILGATLIFSPEAEEAEQKLLESQVKLQNAIGFLENNPENARLRVTSALENAEDTLQKALLLVVKSLALFISISIVIMFAALFFLKKRQNKAEQEHQGRSFIYMIAQC